MRSCLVLCIITLCWAPLAAESQSAWLTRMAEAPATNLHHFWWAANTEGGKALRAATEKSRQVSLELGRPPAMN